MCGVAGVFLKNNKIINRKTLSSFSKSLLHRGPNAQTTFYDNNVSLVHTRLSIVDLVGGDQPLTNDQGHTIVVNGEIYNHIELRKNWQNSYCFKTNSDSEVILASYLLSKDLKSTMSNLRGMYAFACYDSKKEIMFLSRDPFGIKPLYYIEDNRGVVFSSEIKTFLDSGWCSRTPDYKSIVEILQLRYGTKNVTIVANVKRLLPGQTLILYKGKIINSFITNALPKVLSSYQKKTDVLERLKKSLIDSINVHLRSDVPYGLFLSGGLDSAAILSLISKKKLKPIKTFTVSFEKYNTYDERLVAKKLSTYFGTEHEEINLSEKDFWGLLPEVIECMDDLIFDPAMIPTFKMAKIASRNLKVILCGEGSDELFAGYRRYQKVGWPISVGGRFMRIKGVFDGSIIFNKFYEDLWRSSLLNKFMSMNFFSYTKLQCLQSIDMGTWLPNNLLIKLDRCLMSNSLEGRAPFLDPFVVRNSYVLSDKFKVNYYWGKWILRLLVEKEFTFLQPFIKKKGFRVPMENWILKYKKQLSNILPYHESFKYLCNTLNLKNYLQYASKKQAVGVWSLFVYYLWYQRYIKGQTLSDQPFE